MASPLAEAVTLSFDPAPIPGGAKIENFFVEGDYIAIGPFSHGSSLNAGRASNESSGYLELQMGSSIRVERLDGRGFNAYSISLSEYSTVVSTLSVSFTGNLKTGGTVSHTFLLDGVFDSIGGAADFQTLNFPASFRNLGSLASGTTGFSLDNLVVEVPEPTGLSLVSAGVVIALWRKPLRQFWHAKAWRCLLASADPRIGKQASDCQMQPRTE